MTDREMMTVLTALTGETDADALSAALNFAADAVCQRAFPFRKGHVCVPDRYLSKQLSIAAYLLNKRGAEGETVHIENGVHRHYTSAGIPEEYFLGITPEIGLPK